MLRNTKGVLCMMHSNKKQSLHGTHSPLLVDVHVVKAVHPDLQQGCSDLRLKIAHCYRPGQALEESQPEAPDIRLGHQAYQPAIPGKLQLSFLILHLSRNSNFRLLLLATTGNRPIESIRWSRNTIAKGCTRKCSLITGSSAPQIHVWRVG